MHNSPKLIKPHKVQCLRFLRFWFKDKVFPNTGEKLLRTLRFGLKQVNITMKNIKWNNFCKCLRLNVHY